MKGKTSTKNTCTGKLYFVSVTLEHQEENLFFFQLHIYAMGFQLIQFRYGGRILSEGHSPETSEHLLRFWHFHHQHSKRLFIVATRATQLTKLFLTSYIIYAHYT